MLAMYRDDTFWLINHFALRMRVKWNRNLDGNTIIDSNEPLSDYKESGKPSDKSIDRSNDQSSTIPMRSKVRDRSKHRESSGCNLIFGPTRKSSSHRSTSTSSTISSSSSSSPSPSPNQQQQSNQLQSTENHSTAPVSESDRNTMTKLSNFLGLFKLTPSSSSSTNGSIKSSKGSPSHPTSIKVVRRGNSGKGSYESDGIFRTDSRRRRRANNLLQRNSDIRRSWNAAITGRPDVGARGNWARPASPSYRPNNAGNYRSISPSIIGSNNGNTVNGSRAASLDGSGQFANSCKVNSMPAPIVTLPECCLEGSDSETGDGFCSDTKSSTKPETSDTIETNQIVTDRNTDDDGHDEVDKAVDNRNVSQVIRPTGPPPPPPSSATTSVSYDGSLRSSDDVFIQVQITASSTKCKSPSGYPSSDRPITSTNGPTNVTNGRPTGRNSDKQHVIYHQQLNGHGTMGSEKSSGNVMVDESDRPLSPIFESCIEKVNYEESISPTGSLVDSRLDSRSSNEDDVNSMLTNNRPPSSNSCSSTSAEMTLSEDGGLGESVSYDASSGCSWETSSILTGSVCLSPVGSSDHGHINIHGHGINGTMSPSSPSPTLPSPIATSTPRSHHHHHHHIHPQNPHSSISSSPITISDSVFNNSNGVNHVNNDDNYLYEPRMSEVIRVTVKKAEIPEVVTLRSEDIIDYDLTNSMEEHGSPSPPSSSSSFSSSISSVQRISTRGKGNRTGILKDSNCLNSNGLHTCRTSTPKKVHFAESAKVRTTTAISNNGNSDQHSNSMISNCENRSSPLPPSSLDCSNGMLTSKPENIESTNSKQTKLINNNNNSVDQKLVNETTITTSSTVTIKKPTSSSSSLSSSSRRLFQSTINQNCDLDDSVERNSVATNKTQPVLSNDTPTDDGDYSSEQIVVSTQVNPKAFCASNQSSSVPLVSSPLSSSSPLLSSSLSVKSQARFFESISNGSKISGVGGVTRGEGRTAIKPSLVSENNNDNDTNKVTLNGINGEGDGEKEGVGQGINSKSQMFKSPGHNVTSINCTSSVAHVLNHNTSSSSSNADKAISFSSTSTISTSNGKKSNIHNDNNNNNSSGTISGFPYLSRELDAHRKLSALHQRKLAIAREEYARSSLIIQGLGVVVQRLTQQLDSLNGPTLRSQLSQVQNNFDQLEASFVSQEEALRSLKANYSQAERQLREEVAKLTSELADEERRHEREKNDLINSFELELDAARRQFSSELATVEEGKDELKKVVESLKAELNAKISEIIKVQNAMSKMERDSKMERVGRAHRAEERMAFMSKEIQSLKDVLEMKERELKTLRIQVERDQGLNRDLNRAQSTIDVLRQRLEQLEVARDLQADAMNKLKAENEALIGEMIRDQREMDKLALRKEELEYTLYNMVTINGDNQEGQYNNNNNSTHHSPSYGYQGDNVTYTARFIDNLDSHQSLPLNGVNSEYDDIDESVIIDEKKIKELKQKRRTISSKSKESTLISSSSSSATHRPPVSSTSSTSIRIDNSVTSNRYSNNHATRGLDDQNRIVSKKDQGYNSNIGSYNNPNLISDPGFEDNISVYMRTNA